MLACAIIPAYNEAPRIGAVVAVALAADLFARVLVIDDGSADQTAAIAAAAGAQVVRHDNNRGKPAAMRTGLEHTDEAVVCFLDADLLHVQTEHLLTLVGPVVAGIVPAQLAVFAGGRLTTTLAQKVAPMISGQRCLRRELLDGFDGWESGFGIETALNAFLKRQGIDQHIVEWPGASQVTKEEKRGVVPGLLARLEMYTDIFRTWLRTKLG